MRLRAAAIPRQLGMMVHFLPSLSAAMEAGITTIRLTTAIAEKVIPVYISNSPPINMHTLTHSEVQYG